MGRIFLPSRPDRVLVLGSGALQIGQAGEFDYSGSQAIKALQEEGIYTVLINPNVATIQTSEEYADALYLLPVDPHFVERVIVLERVDAILLSFGGQTALNCGLALDESGALARHGVRVLGTPVRAIKDTEDRERFVRRLAEIGVECPKSRAVAGVAEGLAAAREIGYPVILRAGFSLGGRGSAIVADEAECRRALERAFVGVPQVLVEESVAGWKELEYEVVRDAEDNCITVCSMENVDPMGIHTGESIVVAPLQTLNDEEHQTLRSISIAVIRHLGIVGECNIQFALDPRCTRYRVIEVNARLSRSSALASKATGYPLAFVAAKLGLGYTLPQLANAITRRTTAFFEPALDYVVCKAPRWDFEKFPGVDPRLGSEMKSVGEVMAIGRSFPEALQKALRMLEIGADGLDPRAFDFPDLECELAHPTPRRIFAVARAFEQGLTVERVHELTRIDRFFLAEIARVVRSASALREGGRSALGREALVAAKRDGFSDRQIGALAGMAEGEVREMRRAAGVRPRLAQIDTLAAEYPAETNYLYLTYAAQVSDVAAAKRRKVLVLGSGCYRIGSSVEFDWCCVNAVEEARELGYETILLNCNPETVSTDYDVCDRLVFDEITLETVLEICEAESPDGVIVAMGGQTPNSLALKLARAGVRIYGTPPEMIDRTEDRRKFSALCDQLAIDQPRWAEATALADLDRTVSGLGGYPVLVRPSYVLSGAAMRVAASREELVRYLALATKVSPDSPVVLTKFERHAKEIEIDAVADRGEIVLWAVSEHVEDAGVHSGDATLVLPPQWLYIETIRRVQRIGARLARALEITGPFNVQLLAHQNQVKVIECNLRASRSFPFVSKVMGTNFIREATRLALGAPRTQVRSPNPLDLDYVGVKAPMFSFRRLSGVDPILGVEMASTGEVGCLGDDVEEALLKAALATGFRYPKQGVLMMLGPVGDKYRFMDEARALVKMGLKLAATPGTAEILRAEGIACEEVVDGEEPDPARRRGVDLIASGEVDLVISIPRRYDEDLRPDGYVIRRRAVDCEVPLLTDLWLARRVVRAMTRHRLEDLAVKPWSRYLYPVAREGGGGGGARRPVPGGPRR